MKTVLSFKDKGVLELLRSQPTLNTIASHEMYEAFKQEFRSDAFPSSVDFVEVRPITTFPCSILYSTELQWHSDIQVRVYPLDFVAKSLQEVLALFEPFLTEAR